MNSLKLIILLVFFLCIFNFIFGSTAQAVEMELRDSEGRLIMTTSPKNNNPFELGTMAIPVLTSNLAVLALGLLYYKKKLSILLNKIISVTAEFEISRRVTLVIIIILLAFYITFNVGELAEEEDTGDYQFFKSLLEDFKKGELSLMFRPVKFGLSYLSEIIFQNLRTIPFIVSIGVLLLTYLITKEISKKRIAGIVAMIILIQSPVFLKYDTVFAYTNFWIFFYLLSLYLIYKKWYSSPIPFFISFLSKELILAYLPMSLFFIHKIDLTKKKKIFLLGIYGITAIIAGMIWLPLIPATGFYSQTEIEGISDVGFNSSQFWKTLVNILLVIRSDWLVLMFLTPLTVVLFLLRIKRGVVMADSLMLFIFVIILTAALYTAIIDFLHLTSYRMIPLVIFFAIGVGTILSKVGQAANKKQRENKLISYVIFAITLTVTLIPTVTAIFPAALLSFLQ